MLFLDLPLLFAHSPLRQFGDLYAGSLHPLLSLNHFLAIMALGLWAGQHGPRTSRWLSLVIPVGLMGGACLVITGDIAGLVITFNQASLIVLGGFVALELKVPLRACCGFGFLFALTHGYENGIDAVRLPSSLAFCVGLGCCGLVVVTILAAFVIALTKSWQRIAIRVLGSWIVAIGLMLTALP